MALTADRHTPEKPGRSRALPVAGSTTCYLGGLAVLNSGFCEPGSTATGLRAVGRFAETVVNGGADGDETVEVERGIFAFGNSSGPDEITVGNIGQDAYIVDDETVALTDGTGTRSVAGKIYDVDEHGVWVEFV